MAELGGQPVSQGMQGPCPVCNGPYSAYVRDVPTIRTRRDVALFTCLTCKSFWNPGDYTEDERIRELDLKWGISVADRNRESAGRLFDSLAEQNIRPTSVVEVGCGIGTLLTVARDRAIKAQGFDVNDRAVEYAREKNGVDASAELWAVDAPTGPVDLYLCISVLEHLAQPRPLLEQLCRAARERGAALFVSVPFLDEDRWRYLLDPDPESEGTPFFDNDVHVVHFSTDGLMRAFREFGLEDPFVMSGGIWRGVAWRGR